jgi:hypothetical protein
MAVSRLHCLPALVGSSLLLLCSCATPQNNSTVRSDDSPKSGAGSGGAATLTERSALFPVLIEGKYGFMDRSGKVQIQPKFAQALRFSEGLAPVLAEKEQKWGFIDASGEYKIPPTFETVLPFSEGRAVAVLGARYGFIDKSGKFVVAPKYAGASSYKGGLAGIVRATYVLNSEVHSFGYIDQNDKFLFDPVLIDAGNFSEGLAAARWMGEYFSYIDTKGKKVIQPGSAAGMQFQRAGEFSEGLAPVLVFQAGKWGYIDKTGKMVLEPKYAMALSFGEGKAAVLDKSGKWGYIDKTGKMVIEPKFTDAGTFAGGLAQVATEGKKIGYIDDKGAYVWTPRT